MSCPISVKAVDFDQPLKPLELDRRYRSLLLAPRVGGQVLGQILLPAQGSLSSEDLEDAVERKLGDRLWQTLARRVVERAIRGTAPAGENSPPSVSVIVEAHHGRSSAAACLESLAALRVAPAEILVSAPEALTTTAAVAAASGDLVAFVDAACKVDPGWLDGLGRSFRDPLVMAVTGYVGPAELETPAQCRLEARRGMERQVPSGLRGGAADAVDFAARSPARAAYRVGSGVNAIVRRSLLSEGGFMLGGGPGLAEPSLGDLWTFYAVLSSGYRIALEPARVAWLRYPESDEDAGAAIRESAAQASAFAAACALRCREPGAAWKSAALFRGDGSPLRRHAMAGAIRGLARLHTPRMGSSEAPAMQALYAERNPSLSGSSIAGINVTREEDPRLAVLTPTYGRVEKLQRLLQALCNQTYPKERFAVTVVVDGSEDGSAEAARSLEVPYDLRVVEQPRRGVSVARNRAVAESDAPLLVNVDDDMVPDPGWLEAHARAHREGKDDLLAIGYCPAAIGEGGLWQYMLRAWWEDHYRGLAEPDHPWTWIDFSVGNSSFRRSLFEAVGGFDETFKRRNADQELGMRLVEAGARFQFQPAARAWHHFETELRANLGDARRQGLYDVLLTEKHPRLRRRVYLQGWFRPDGSMRPKPALAFRLSGTLAPLVGPLARGSRPVERLRLRRTWYRLNDELRGISYLLGVKDALDSGSVVERPGGPRGLGEESELLRGEIGEAGAIAISPEGFEPELQLSYRGTELARLPAMRTGNIWSWDDLIDRATEACLGPLRSSLDLEQMQQLAATETVRPSA